MTTVGVMYLNGVWGSSATDIFAVGGYYYVDRPSYTSNNILHYDGSSWSQTGDWGGILHDVWGSSGTDVFAVDLYGGALHYDGTSWSPMSTPNYGSRYSLYGVWGASGTDVFAVGAYGTILHYDGTANASPSASFSVSPPSIRVNQVLEVDASGCLDFEDATDSLEVRWDWESDKIWDTPYSIIKTARHAYSAVGTYTITLEVKDSGRKTDTATRQISVTSSGGVGPCLAESIYGEDSEQVKLLRGFRDDVLITTLGGRKLTQLYYQWSPLIVERMKEDEEFKEEVKEVIDKLLPVLQEIAQAE
jgi:hypothetical protein